MGNNINTFCSCAENQKATEHTIADFKEAKTNSHHQNEKYSEISADELIKKSKGMIGAVGSFGASDVDTADCPHEYTTGTIKINNDLTYVGSIVNGKKYGKGIVKNKTGQLVYEGYFKDDLYDGDGTLIMDNGLIFNGNFKKGKRDGRGLVFSTNDKFRYDGEWKNDFKWGQGTETYPDGSSYVGIFENNKKNGKGNKIKFLI